MRMSQMHMHTATLALAQVTSTKKFCHHSHQAHRLLCPGFVNASRPLDSLRVGGQFDKMSSGFSLPSRVIPEGAIGGVRNPALLNRPVATTHR